MTGTLLSDLLPSCEVEYARERMYHALDAVRSQLSELEALAEDDELIRSAATALLEAHASQLTSIVCTYERARSYAGFKSEGSQIAA